MHKYLKTVFLSFQDALAYRFNLVFLIFKEFLMLGVFVLLWSTIYSEGNSLAGFEFRDILLYYFGVSFISLSASDAVAWILSDDIRQGNVLNFILKPLRGFWYWFCINLGHRTGNGIFIIPLYVIGFCVLIFGHYLLLEAFLMYLVFVVGMFFLMFVVYFFLGTIAFFTDSAWGFILSWIFIAGFLGGRILPVDAFPQWLIKINAFLPFQYFYYVPARMLAGDFSHAGFFALMLIAWTVFFAAAGQSIWYYGLRRYEAYGG
ncbi:MAG: hypothetical protein A3F54_01445 [Candidatus Kerfeldbacteria bacterium RIFCSPHIGHO2_12_FULL_48_17]|uniref:ABC transporter permease n=1 Tax=Candidatus Kerfeldbacteria bacterium RIFCSPHIGHO2_12_FULL_48_17 TaxID=1798542 RepID=A0A1G2AXT5_9BACT|nr:MAG: hypothetical protein A3F54_01445 [Candidatus Kerfeldbacteria bacterium RIFCSPHIGHO2_12_FULL_48_17]